jgi:hypothetical protein
VCGVAHRRRRMVLGLPDGRSGFSPGGGPTVRAPALAKPIAWPAPSSSRRTLPKNRMWSRVGGQAGTAAGKASVFMFRKPNLRIGPGRRWTARPVTPGDVASPADIV